jgi:hypothetical protein
MAVSGVARRQAAQLAAIFNPFEHPTPYAYPTKRTEKPFTAFLT